MVDVHQMPDRAFRRARWSISTPMQRNVSEFSASEQMVRLSGASRWALSAEHIPLIGEDSARLWRSFMAKMRGGENVFPFYASEGAQAVDYPIISNQWHAIINRANTSVSGRTVTKSGGTNGAYDASAVTSASWTGAATLSFRAASTAIGFFAGLNTDPMTDDSFGSIDYAFRCDYDGTLMIYESGSLIATVGQYSTSDLLTIHYSGTTVRYMVNGQIVRSVAVSAGLSFYFDSSIHFLGAAITDIVFQNGSTIAAGSTSATLTGLAATAQALKEGWYATAILQRGGAQLVVITEDVSNAGGGSSTARTVKFLPELRGAAIGFIADDPFGLMRLTDSQASLDVDAGQIYGFAVDAVEAF